MTPNTYPGIKNKKQDKENINWASPKLKMHATKGHNKQTKKTIYKMGEKLANF
jgi:hypothetical protein